MAGMVYKSKRLVSDALHFEKHFLAAAVVEFRGAAAGVAGNSLSGFKGSVISQKLRDPRVPGASEANSAPYEVPDVYVSSQTHFVSTPSASRLPARTSLRSTCDGVDRSSFQAQLDLMQVAELQLAMEPSSQKLQEFCAFE